MIGEFDVRVRSTVGLSNTNGSIFGIFASGNSNFHTKIKIGKLRTLCSVYRDSFDFLLPSAWRNNCVNDCGMHVSSAGLHFGIFGATNEKEKKCETIFNYVSFSQSDFVHQLFLRNLLCAFELFKVALKLPLNWLLLSFGIVYVSLNHIYTGYSFRTLLNHWQRSLQPLIRQLESSILRNVVVIALNLVLESAINENSIRSTHAITFRL